MHILNISKFKARKVKANLYAISAMIGTVFVFFPFRKHKTKDQIKEKKIDLCFSKENSSVWKNCYSRYVFQIRKRN